MLPHMNDSHVGRLLWSIGHQEYVATRIIRASVHYAPGSKDWDTLLPSGGHLINIKNEEGFVSQHTVAMFHQLRCLDILQKEYMDFTRTSLSMLAGHCLNYLREMVLCQLDITAEAQILQTSLEGHDKLCRDWSVVYEEAERNYVSITNTKRETK